MKQNLQLHDEAAYQRSSQLLMQALCAHEDFRNFAFPVAIAAAADDPLHQAACATAPMPTPPSSARPTWPLRSDLSCTIFLSDPASYEGGALRIQLGTRDLRFKGAPGSAIVYPSDSCTRSSR